MPEVTERVLTASEVAARRIEAEKDAGNKFADILLKPVLDHTLDLIKEATP